MSTETLEAITQGLREAVGTDCGLGRVVKFDFGTDGVVVIDASTVPNVVANDDRAADCTLRQSIDDFIAISEGKLNSTQAFMTGRLKIEGDLSLAMRIDGALAAKP